MGQEEVDKVGIGSLHFDIENWGGPFFGYGELEVVQINSHYLILPVGV